MARRLPRRVGKPRPAQLAADAVVVVCLAGLADGAGDAQLPLQLVAGVAEAGVQPRAPGVRPAVGLARAARDVERAVALGGDLLPRRAAAAVHARAARVLVGARGLVAAGPARLAEAIGAGLRAHVADALHLPCAPVRRLARRTRLAEQRACAVSGSILRTHEALELVCDWLSTIDFDLRQLKKLKNPVLH